MTPTRHSRNQTIWNSGTQEKNHDKFAIDSIRKGLKKNWGQAKFHKHGKVQRIVTGKEKRAGIIGGLVLIGLGIAAIANPDLMKGAEASGRHFLIKLIFVYLWSRPGGVIAILLGFGSIWGAVTPDDSKAKESVVVKAQAIEPAPSPAEESKAPKVEVNDDRKYAPPGYFD